MNANQLQSGWRFRKAARCLQKGGIVAYPTEAVYGLGCDPLNPKAVERLLQLKGRAPHKGFILIASDITQLAPYIDITPAIREKLEASWPGPVTWIVPTAQGVPALLTGGRDSIAVRVTAHPLASALCAAFGGAIVSTSANLSGKRAAKNALQVRQRLSALPEIILHGAVGKQHKPTQIRNAINDEIVRK